MKKPSGQDRTASEGNYVARATRRRRRILQSRILSCFIGNTVIHSCVKVEPSYEIKNAPRGCAARGKENIALRTARARRISQTRFFLIKEECKTFKKVDFQVLDPDSEGGRQILLDVCGSFGSGNEYTTIFLNKSCYDIFGTFSPWRLPKDEFNRLIKKNEAEMNSQQTDK